MNSRENTKASSGKLPWVIIALIPLLLLLAHLAAVNARPMHADEATQAYIFADLLEQGDYHYDPRHHHGPAAHFLHFILLRPFGIESLDTLQPWQFRLQGILLGGLCSLLAALALLPNKRAACFAALFAGTSPLLFYFNGMAIPETLLGTLALGIPLLAIPVLKGRAGLPSCILTGILLGLLLATKETWAIIGLSWLAAILLLYPRQVLSTVRRVGFPRLAITAFCGLLCAALLYSNFSKNPQGLPDALKTFFVYETSPLHNKAWHYYLKELLLPRPALGSFIGEGLLFISAIAGLVIAFLKRKDPRPETLSLPSPAAFFGTAALVQILIYSLIPYKTPWLLLVPILYLIPAAAEALAAIRSVRLSCFAALLLALANLHQTATTSFLHSTALENPYAYAPTLPEAEQVLKALDEELPGEAFIAVVGSDYWPIPWYFRQRRERVGYYPDVPENPDSFSLILYVKEAFYEAPRDLPPGHVSIPFSLRSGAYVDAQFKVETR